MPLNSSKQDEIEFRRMKVAQRRIQMGETQRQIAAYLGVSVGTINRDLKALDLRWRNTADLDIKGHRAQQLAEIYQVKRWAWLDVGNPAKLRTILQAVKLEAQITGTIQPPSFVFNLGIIQQFVEALQDDPSVGESFAEWFKTFNAQKQQEGVQLEAHNHADG